MTFVLYEYKGLLYIRNYKVHSFKSANFPEVGLVERFFENLLYSQVDFPNEWMIHHDPWHGSQTQQIHKLMKLLPCGLQWFLASFVSRKWQILRSPLLKCLDRISFVATHGSRHQSLSHASVNV